MVNNRYCTVTNIVAFSCVHHKVVAHVIMSQRSIASFFSKSSSLLIYKGGKYILRTYMVYRFYVALYRKNKFLPVQGTGWWKRLAESLPSIEIVIFLCVAPRVLILGCITNFSINCLVHCSCSSLWFQVIKLFPDTDSKMRGTRLFFIAGNRVLKHLTRAMDNERSLTKLLRSVRCC